MKGLLKYVGLFIVGRMLFSSLSQSLGNKISVAFKGIKRGSIDWDNSSLKASILITNNFNFPIRVKDFEGILMYGSVRANVSQVISVILEESTTTIIDLDISVNNSDFFFQLARLIKSGQVPALKVDGVLSVSAAGEIIDFPISKSIPIL